MGKRNDYIIAALIGFVIGWLALFPESHFGVHPTLAVIIVTVIGATAFVPLWLLWCSILGRRHCAIQDFGKFTAVGALNSFIDLGILNLFMLLTGISSGIFFVIAKTVAYICASTNSYFFNKVWTFRSGAPILKREYALFVILSLIGAVVNVGVTAFVVQVIPRPMAVSGPLWANIASLVGTLILMIWNFFSYRTYVFTKQQ
ncbi:MAG: GtrA family protein [Candidatus Paceibacterota bacterium]|jgi:putative flippase GtrA